MATSDDKTVEDEKCALVVVNLMERIAPHMSDAAREALRPDKHDGWSDDIVAIARMWSRDPDADDVRQLGVDLSVMVEMVGAKVGAVDGLLSTPLLVPMSDGRFIVLLYARVVGAERPEAQATLREMLPQVCGMHVFVQGELPPVYVKP